MGARKKKNAKILLWKKIGNNYYTTLINGKYSFYDIVLDGTQTVQQQLHSFLYVDRNDELDALTGSYIKTIRPGFTTVRYAVRVNEMRRTNFAIPWTRVTGFQKIKLVLYLNQGNVAAAASVLGTHALVLVYLMRRHKRQEKELKNMERILHEKIDQTKSLQTNIEEKLQNTINHLNEQLKGKENIIAGLEQQNKAILAQIKSQEEIYKQITEKQQETERELKALNKSLMTILNHSHDIGSEEMIENIKKHITGLVNQQKQNEIKRKKTMQYIKQLTDQLDAQQEDLVRIVEKTEHLVQQIKVKEELQNTINHMNEQLKGKASTIAGLEQQIEGQTKINKYVNDRLRDIINHPDGTDSKTMIDDLVGWIEELDKELTRKDKAFTKLEDEKVQLRDERDTIRKTYQELHQVYLMYLEKVRALEKSEQVMATVLPTGRGVDEYQVQRLKSITDKIDEFEKQYKVFVSEIENAPNRADFLKEVQSIDTLKTQPAGMNLDTWKRSVDDHYRKYFEYMKNVTQDIKYPVSVHIRLFRGDTTRMRPETCDANFKYAHDKEQYSVTSTHNNKEYGPFSSVFTSTSTTNEVFAKIRDVVAQTASGYSVFVIMLGGSGSGKTFTLSGSPNDKGIIELALDNLRHSYDLKSYRVRSVTEDYMGNQTWQGNEGGRGKQITHSLKGKTDIATILTAVNGTRARKHRIFATVNNKESSRSHLLIDVELTFPNNKTGNIAFCDLAGRENPLEILQAELGYSKDEVYGFMSQSHFNNEKKKNIHRIMLQGFYINESLNWLSDALRQTEWLTEKGTTIVHTKRKKHGDMSLYDPKDVYRTKAASAKPYILSFIEKIRDRSEFPSKVCIIGCVLEGVDTKTGTCKTHEKYIRNKDMYDGQIAVGASTLDYCHEIMKIKKNQ